MGDAQIGEWLRAKSELKTAETQLLNMLSQAERLAKALADWRSSQSDSMTGWPDARMANDALTACREAQQKLSRADAALSSQDRKLLEPALKEPEF